MFAWEGSAEEITKLLLHLRIHLIGISKVMYWWMVMNGWMNRWVDGLIETCGTPVPISSISCNNNCRVCYKNVMREHDNCKIYKVFNKYIVVYL